MAKFLKINDDLFNLGHIVSVEDFGNFVELHLTEHNTIVYTETVAMAVRYFFANCIPQNFVTDVLSSYDCHLQSKKWQADFQALLSNIQEATGCDYETARKCVNTESDLIGKEAFEAALAWYQEHFANKE